MICPFSISLFISCENTRRNCSQSCGCNISKKSSSVIFSFTMDVPCNELNVFLRTSYTQEDILAASIAISRFFLFSSVRNSVSFTDVLSLESSTCPMMFPALFHKEITWTSKIMLFLLWVVKYSSSLIRLKSYSNSSIIFSSPLCILALSWSSM